MHRQLFVVFVSVLGSFLPAQIGGNGSDGAFVPSKDTVIDTRWNGGKFNFTKIVIPKGVTVTVIGPNPAILFVTGLVRIDGVLSASGRAQSPGPAGFKGGDHLSNGLGPGGGGAGSRSCSSGSGGGGGHAAEGQPGYRCRLISPGGKVYGSAVPFVASGGSGGGGAISGYGVGGGGGGVIALITDGPIQGVGRIEAAGADIGGRGGGGAGGSILLRSLSPVSIPMPDVDGGVTPVSTGGLGGRGYLRVDVYGSTPPTWTKLPFTVALRLPDLDRTTGAQIGSTLKLRVIALPDDTILLAGAAKGADINFPPFGTLKLDPSTLFIYGIKKATSGLDGIATFDVPIPNNPLFLGMMVHWQALNTITISKRPLLTNNLITTLK